MSDLIKIAVDAMGGDGSPKKIIDGIILNHSINKNNFLFILLDLKLVFLYTCQFSDLNGEIIDTLHFVYLQ